MKSKEELLKEISKLISQLNNTQDELVKTISDYIVAAPDDEELEQLKKELAAEKKKNERLLKLTS